MKRDGSNLFIVISSLALFAVLLIQVNWILETAQMKEELFNEKANMVLSRTADALNAGEQIPAFREIAVGEKETKKTDSLLRHFMRIYNIHIDYVFELKKGPILPVPKSPGDLLDLDRSKSAEQAGTYQTCLAAPPDKSSLLLKLVFPEKRQFILAEMGPMFVISIALILIVLVLTWRTIMALLKEKRISEHTTEFLNNMTHEFKTPLTNIALAGNMIGRESLPEDKIRHYSGIIREENEKLIQQVEQVLSMSALERGEIPLHKTTLDMRDIVDEALKCIRMQMEDRQGKLTLNMDAVNHIIHGDRTHLIHALCNLLDNAIKYSRDQPDISISTSNPGTGLQIDISDKGIGIEKRYHRKVFNKFFRVPTGDLHDVKGFGLGLAYIRKIIELHGGSITLNSHKGQGTIFKIMLPND